VTQDRGSTGSTAGSPQDYGRPHALAGQAAGPLLNPVEMTMSDKWAVVDRLRTSNPIDPTYPGANYVVLFNAAYAGLGDVLATVPAYVAGAPVPAGVLEIYDHTAQAIGEFEKSTRFNKFNSKYDDFLTGNGTLTTQELKGLKLFEGKGKCALCHLSQPGLAPNGDMLPPLFTDFTYDNWPSPTCWPCPLPETENR